MLEPLFKKVADLQDCFSIWLVLRPWNIHVRAFNPFFPNAPFLYSWKLQKTDVFKGALGKNRLIKLFFSKIIHRQRIQTACWGRRHYSSNFTNAWHIFIKYIFIKFLSIITLRSFLLWLSQILEQPTRTHTVSCYWPTTKRWHLSSFILTYSRANNA